MLASASDFPCSGVLAAIAGDGGEADDHGDFFGRQLPDLVHPGDQRGRGDVANSGDRGEDFEAPGEDGIGVDLTFDFGFEVGDGFVEGAQLPLQLGDQHGALACADLVDNSGSIIDEALPASRQFLKVFDDFGGRGDGVGGKALAHDRQHAGIDPVGLGQRADGLGEFARTQRIDDGDLEIRCRADCDAPGDGIYPSPP